MDGRKKRIGEIISRCGINSFGFCGFDSLRDRLIECSGCKRLPKAAAGVIVLIFPYLLSDENYINSDISKYAVVRDYHSVAGDILKDICALLQNEWQNESFVPFVDSSPIPEVYAACLAGLGKRGKNGLLITEKYGSWVFIGEIVTTLEFSDAVSEAVGCISCSLCEKSCPGGAIGEGGIDREKCLSHISQKKGELSPEEAQMIRKSSCVWGCDICQTVCPLNRGAQTTDISMFLSGIMPTADENILEDRAYGWRGKSVISRNLKILYGTEE